MGTNVGKRRLCGFFHYISQLARQHETLIAGHLCRFDEQDVSPRWRPGQAGGNTGLTGAFGHLRIKFDRPQ